MLWLGGSVFWRSGQIGQLVRVIKLAQHQKAAIGTELRTSKFQPHASVEIHPICPLQARTLWVIHETCPSKPTTP